MESIEAMVTRHDEQIKVANHRIDDLETITKNIYDLSFTNKQILLELQKTNDNVKEVKDEIKKTNIRIDDIESQPYEDYKSVKKKVIDTIVTSVVSALIGGLIAFAITFIKIGG